jgi:hypothetical protein
MPELTVNSWNELQEALHRDAWKPDINRFRSPFVFRGMGNASACLETTLARLGGNYARLEPPAAQLPQIRHRELVEQDTFWHWRAWRSTTACPLACWIGQFRRWSLPICYRQPGKFTGRDHLDGERPESQAALPESCELFCMGKGRLFHGGDAPRLSPTCGTWMPWDRTDCPLFEPPSMDERITNQFALFPLCLDGQRSDDWLEDHPGFDEGHRLPG